MQRNLDALIESAYDVLVVGGGIYGACVAWDAAARGLSVALVEKSDFGGATSANSLKIIHGGLRYLQHADFKRMRESIRERKALLTIAPHLIHPLPILVPTYGHGVKGREAMTVALALNDVISCDRNWALPDAKHIPSGRILSKQACLERLPGLDPQGLTGGAQFCDAQVYNSERLTLAFLKAAHEAGAKLANYARVTGFLRQRDRIAGVTVRDELTGSEFDLQAKLVVNTAGPWIQQLQQLAAASAAPQQPTLLAKAINLVVPSFIQDYAVGLSSKVAYRDQDAVIDKGSRFLFTAPWRGRSMVGTWYLPFEQSPDAMTVTEAELQMCLDDINGAYPLAQLSLNDILFVHCGLLPATGVSAKTGDVQLAKHYHLQDHAQEGMPGLLSITGVKYTTARDVAEKAVNQIGQRLGRALPGCTTAQTPLPGGDIADLPAFLQATQQLAPQLSPERVQSLVFNYGTEATAILNGMDGAADPETALIQATARHAVRQEMAQHLTDVVLRRTELASAGLPSPSVLETCAEAMAADLQWDLTRRHQELQAVYQFFAARVPQYAVPAEAALRS